VPSDAPLPSLLVQLPFPTREEFLRRHGANLTAGGLYVRTPRVKPLGTEAVVEVRLPSGERLIYAQVRVEFVSGQAGKGIAGMGLRFTHVDADTQRFLDKVAASYLHARNPLPPTPHHVGPVTWADPLPVPPPPAPPPAAVEAPPAEPTAEAPAANDAPAAESPASPALDAAAAGAEAAEAPPAPTATEAAGVKGFFKKLFGG
jgi:molecular chaperone DnaK